MERAPSPRQARESSLLRYSFGIVQQVEDRHRALLRVPVQFSLLIAQQQVRRRSRELVPLHDDLGRARALQLLGLLPRLRPGVYRRPVERRAESERRRQRPLVVLVRDEDGRGVLHPVRPQDLRILAVAVHDRGVGFRHQDGVDQRRVRVERDDPRQDAQGAVHVIRQAELAHDFLPHLSVAANDDRVLRHLALFDRRLPAGSIAFAIHRAGLEGSRRRRRDLAEQGGDRHGDQHYRGEQPAQVLRQDLQLLRQREDHEGEFPAAREEEGQLDRVVRLEAIGFHPPRDAGRGRDGEGLEQNQ
mmetsp:Transcript_3600/g.7508  ORF Transcript_3600/g.7508 Transcript_3600/m.7508 type:complete len:302 (-) Transcript_3600:197-1102(-)